jgi:hypothetical protein
MSTRRLAIVIAIVLAVVLVVAVIAADDDTPTSPSPVPPSPAASPSSSASGPAPATPAPSPSASTLAAATFSSNGEFVSGWYWLRDVAREASGTWQFTTLPVDGDLVFDLEVLATDADGARGRQATFFFSWAAGTPAGADDWAGRLPVTLPNVSPADDPTGYTCRGTVTVPRTTLGATSTLTVMIGRTDVRDELPPVDVPVAVDATSVELRLP